jgi:hypothetical protein
MDTHQKIPLPEDDVPPSPANKAVKLPPFWPANPAAWFEAAEGSFRRRLLAAQQLMNIQRVKQLSPLANELPVFAVPNYYKRGEEGKKTQRI